MRKLFISLSALFIGFIVVPEVAAVPSYARQTGLACSGCHYTPPELNRAGRMFKLMGYIDKVRKAEVTSPEDKKHAGLDLLATLPLSAWFETSFTNTKAPQPSTQNGNFEFPQDISLFLAGAWSTHIGSFLQVTYSTQDDHFSMDNTDIRYANKREFAGKQLVYGLTLNNNPTVEDLWNTTPAWGFPFIASDAAPTPAAAPLIQGGLAQDVAGLGAYTMWNEHLYLGGTIYRSGHIGTAQPPTGQDLAINIRGIAPYWRVAWQQNSVKNSFEIGAYGLHAKSTPLAVTGLQDSYTDTAADFQFDRNVGKDVFSLRGTYIRENSSLLASLAAGIADRNKHHLDAFNANAEYHFGNRYSTAFGWFTTSGTSDALLYAPAAVSGSANGNPRSSGYILNFSVWPVQNFDLAVQYTGYTRFNGAGTNYDAAGRNASDDNTVYLLARFVF